MLTKRNCNLPLVCLVCGDTARGINFNVMSCLSCKTFFRRHGNKPKKKQSRRCSKENNCEINQKTRGCCSACRLQKCLALGMDAELIGNRRFNLNKCSSVKDMKIVHVRTVHSLPQPCTLSLLQNDRSTLSRDEWDLLSNIIHAYDATEIIPTTKQLFEAQLMLPLKVRSKPTTALNIYRRFYALFIPFVQRTRYFHEISFETSEELTQNNFRGFGIFHSGYIMRELNGLHDPLLRSGLSTFYTGDVESKMERFVSRLESDPSLIKIILMILAFSPNSSIVSFDMSSRNYIAGNSLTISKIQDTIVTMFWKYLLYKYGFVAAVQRLSSHVKYLIDMLQTAHEQQGEQIRAVVHTMIDDAKQSLTIKD